MASQAHAGDIHRTDDPKPGGATAVPPETPAWVFRQGHLDEQPIITWLLVSLWAFKRQGIKLSNLTSSGK